ncbi:hypothetical protein B0T10DRAFT_70985 [Thelonectria olida]|uniref:Uncharacterized protein n=1 Tax=Thelonectria olida TaxID=1576542 RepID=A0A9P8W2C7_9HYPO|nr:hypothetical protein B0T10DRAFT_70985 [Thelonectria olida]
MDKKRQLTLEEYFASPDVPLRPIMTSLNGDNSWLLSFPRPPPDRLALGKAFYHVVFEPWLAGSTSMLSSWVIWISLSAKPDVSDPEAIEGVIRQIEALAATGISVNDSQEESSGDYTGDIDAILLGFHYLDHLHEPTLRLFNKNIPVIAIPEAVDIVKPWGHFESISTIKNFDPSFTSWQDSGLHPGEPLPSWLTPIRMPGHHELNYCLALVWSHADDSGEEVHEVMFQSPHGTRLDEGPLQAFLDSEPKTEKLAMLHGLKESYTAGMITTLGAKGGLAFYRRIGGAKYWILSHHSTLLYGGIFMRLSWTNDIHRTMDWALGEESKAGGQKADLDRPNMVQVENGGCVVLKI